MHVLIIYKAIAYTQSLPELWWCFLASFSFGFVLQAFYLLFLYLRKEKLKVKVEGNALGFKICRWWQLAKWMDRESGDKEKETRGLNKQGKWESIMKEP